MLAPATFSLRWTSICETSRPGDDASQRVGLRTAHAVEHASLVVDGHDLAERDQQRANQIPRPAPALLCRPDKRIFIRSAARPEKRSVSALRERWSHLDIVKEESVGLVGSFDLFSRGTSSIRSRRPSCGGFHHQIRLPCRHLVTLHLIAASIPLEWSKPSIGARDKRKFFRIPLSTTIARYAFTPSSS